ncbi:MAG: VWA domain-containing protein [Coriobacteriia bacterium]|nr:VWA domain-containing protein [Coriobacteriia bacterium]
MNVPQGGSGTGKGRGGGGKAPADGAAPSSSASGKKGGHHKSKTDRRPPRTRQEDRTILINFVLDKSGSMDVIRQATISGFNEFLRDQRREGGRAFMTLTLFDTQFHTVAHAVDVRHMAPLDSCLYEPGGCTALYDAIGHSMHMTDDYVAKHRPDQVLFVVMTDGMENSSREFDQRMIFDLIAERQESAGYEFVYLGANQDSYAASVQMGMRPGRSLDWMATPEEAAATLKRVSHNVRAYRRAGVSQMNADVFFSDAFEASGAVDYEEYKRRAAAGVGLADDAGSAQEDGPAAG